MRNDHVAKGGVPMRIAIIPGSFDPMTLGHKNVVERALKFFDRVIVAIMINPEKRGTFSFAERKRIAELTLAEFPQVTVITADGYLADLASALKAVAIVKGVRNTEDFEYEQDMAVFNHDRNPVTETVYLPSYGEMSDISSTYARSRIELGVPLDGVLAPEAIEYIESLGK
jgi:pantetheine-phosphate adenylyltransferase